MLRAIQKKLQTEFNCTPSPALRSMEAGLLILNGGLVSRQLHHTCAPSPSGQVKVPVPLNLSLKIGGILPVLRSRNYFVYARSAPK